MLKVIRTAVFVCAALAACAVQARAESIGPDCGSCQGSIYTLENLGIVGDIYGQDLNLFDTYQFKLTIDATNYNGGGYAIDEVAIKVSSSTDNTEIVDAPGDASLWNLVPGGISAGGCSGSGGGFDCADWYLKTASVAIVPGSVWSWTFNVDVGSGGVFLFDGSTETPSIKVRYVDIDGNKVGALVSEKVPEPASLALLGVGMSLAAIRRRRA